MSGSLPGAGRSSTWSPWPIPELACAGLSNNKNSPFSGEIPLRVTPEVHQAATTAARTEGKSLDAWIAETVERAAGHSA